MAPGRHDSVSGAGLYRRHTADCRLRAFRVKMLASPSSDIARFGKLVKAAGIRAE
jgi:hypothetical protein